MLILEGTEEQEIVIRGDITVKVLHVGSRRASIGFNAPDDVGIRRRGLPNSEDIPSHKPHENPEGMLVFTMRPNDIVDIDGGITVLVRSVRKSGKIKMGVDAPSDTSILRRELIGEDREGHKPHRSRERF